MAAIPIKRNYFLSRFKTFLPSQHFYHNFVDVGNKPQSRKDKESVSKPGKWAGEINFSKWKKMDSRSLGITRVMVPSSPYTLLKILRSSGFESYLVGGCVRDLLLNKTPKDFDVITTADLNQIKKQFHRCIIVGRRFPICRVHIKGSVIEVSSFKTLAKHSESKEKFLISQMPRGCNQSDLNLWKNSMHRDFTVNSLFFDPINFKIYDYNNAMKDLLELKLRTLVPAHISFTEDCARILRGLRIAARLGLSLSKDIETAIYKQASSILNLSPPRIMMEMDYMLAYGAAESSLRLLHKYNILEILLPFQAAYISRHTARSGECTMMLMKLFSHMDKLVSCGQPSACSLWIGILAFHQALVNKPQHPFVVLTFASVLYHQSWEDGLKFARKTGGALVSYEPEILDPYKFISDEEVAIKVKKLAMRVMDSIEVFVDADSQQSLMSKFPAFSCSGLVFISKNAAHATAQLFHVLVHKVETYDRGRSSFEMNHELLGKGDASETRFVLGKIILNTMGCEVEHDNHNHPALPEFSHVTPSDSRLQQPNAYNPKSEKLNPKSNSGKEQNLALKKRMELIEDGYLIEQEQWEEDISTKHVEALVTPSCLNTEDNDMEKPEEISASQSPTQKSINSKKQKLSENLSSSNKQNAAIQKKINYIEDERLPEQEQWKEVSSELHVEVLNTSSCPNVEHPAMEKSEEMSVSQSPMHELIYTLEAITENEKLPSQLEAQNSEEKLTVDAEAQVDQSTTIERSVNTKHKRKKVLPLSSLFK
uniref:uncharacterized protein LOC122602557 isoform X2 n=1 Tax=Erigeron canadensis TaxID=72917 RepID=UPI001CB99C26|nr:uncharacterized protein LOC122602557 isoform X2 [Erigeron canadensis]